MICENVTVGAGTQFPLSGLLTLPDDLTKPAPAVVLVHGSGASNMDERVKKLTPFRDLAEGLSRRGVAALRYDKRTFAYARQMAKVSPTVREETVDDALAAAALLRADARIDAQRVFLIGHSMGAMLAPRIDAEGGDFRGLILMAGSPYRMEEIVLRQLRQAGEGRALLGRIIGAQVKTYEKKFANLYEMSDEEARRKKFAGSVSLYYFKEMGCKTAADYLLESEKPVLILQGEKDFQVLAADDYERFRTLLKDRPNTSFRLYPGLDHLFVESICDDITKAAKEVSVERHIGENVIGDIADFIHAS